MTLAPSGRENLRVTAMWIINPKDEPITLFSQGKEDVEHSRPQVLYLCACGNSTHGRVLAEQRRLDGRLVKWSVCSCPLMQPTILIEHGEAVITQFPQAREFRTSPSWPADICKLFDDASIAYGAGAYTATAMVCRKIVMLCSCLHGEPDGKSFNHYVNHITDEVLQYPKAKAAIDAIRLIGNEANHEVHFVDQHSAKRALNIISYMLNTIYSLPLA